MDEQLHQPEFKIFTGILRAFEKDGRKRLSGVASSTTRDLHGDVMEESALRDMEIAANQNLTIFLNHSYEVPEDVAGSVEKAVVKSRGVDGDGNPNWDLDFDIVINEGNDRAVKAWEAMSSGTKLGLSIGAMIPKDGATRDKKTGALSISHVHLLETSIVSIPANPRSWISSAVKAWNKAEKGQKMDLGAPELDLQEDGTYTITGRLQGGTINSTSTSTFTVGEQGPEEFTPLVTINESVVVDVTESDIEPEVQDASVRIIEIDTGPEPADPPSSQEAPESDPGTETLSASVEGAEGTDLATDVAADLQLDPVIRQAVESMSLLLETTTERLVAATEELGAEKQARLTAESERDEALKAAADAIGQCGALIERLANMPVGRKTKFLDVQRDFEHLSRIYDEPIRKLLMQEPNFDG